jgi:hypothetical protein
MLENFLFKFNYMKIFRKMSGHFQKSNHIFNVLVTTVEGLKNVILKVWEELVTQNTVKEVIYAGG